MKLNPKTNDAYRLLHDGALALARAEQQGIRLDEAYAKRKHFQLSKKIEILEAKFRKSTFCEEWRLSIGGKSPNIYSNAQLSYFLYKIKKLRPASATQSGQGSTDEDSLSQLNIPELDILLQIRKLKKIRDTYLEGFVREAVDGIIHPSFNLHLVRTFRSSSDRPNFQNIPKRDKEAMMICRKALFPRPNHQLIEVDLSGAEVRIAACYHQDPTMIKYINDPTADMHADMASQLFMIDHFDKSLPEHKYLRSATKNGFIFPQFYGDYYKNCAENMAHKWGKLSKGRWKSGQGIAMPNGSLSDHLISKGIKSLEAFETHVKKIEDDFWGRRFRVYAKWKDRWYARYLRYGYVDLFTGFRCSGIMSRNDSINYPIQGTAFHCLLFILTALDKEIFRNGWESRIISQVHDSIIIDVEPRELSLIINTIKYITAVDLPKTWNWINVPIEMAIETAEVNRSLAYIK